MGNIFLAKSNGETVVEHTKKLIQNFEKLIELYPNIEVDKRLLLLACIYHDLGKINAKFQYKVSNEKRKSLLKEKYEIDLKKNEIPHGILSTAFINSNELLKENFDKEDIKILAHSVALHHERDISEIEDEDFKEEIKKMEFELNDFETELTSLENIYFEIIKKIYGEIKKYSIFKREDDNFKIKKLSKKYYKLNDRIYSEKMYMKKEEALEIFKKYVLLKGLLNKIDYAASSYTTIEEKNDFLEIEMEKFLEDVLRKDNPKNDWNALQKFMKQHKDENVVIVAQTGYGKTEAGLLWIGNNKGFFTLPLRVAINAIYDRVVKNIVRENVEKRIGLLHSDFREYYTEKNSKENKLLKNEELSEYINKTKQFSLPLTICTIDQLFDFVFRAPGFELKVATLSYSKVVIDEIQMYSADLLAYLIYGLKYITDFGGKFAIMTATLPGIVTYLLEKEGVKFVTTEPFTNDKKRHSLKVMEESINAEFIKGKYRNNKILVICNTVKKAKEIYENLNIPKEELNLIHSRFIKRDRTNKEKEITEFANPKRFRGDVKNKREKEGFQENGVWIGTQVLEASLDLDFDILITELSDLNGLFQRMGRCFRNREKVDEGYNCFVFTKECSGIKGAKAIIDKEIHEKSKSVLLKVDGIISEVQKLDLINSVYSYESLKDTKYFNKVTDNIKYLKEYVVEYEKTKSEVQRIFRNIASYDVIPRIIYEENFEEINRNIEILREKMKGLSEDDRKKLRIRKIEARGELNKFKVTIPDFEYRKLEKSKKNEIEKIKVNDYEELVVVNCGYSYEKGFEVVRGEEEDNFF